MTMNERSWNEKSKDVKNKKLPRVKIVSWLAGLDIIILFEASSFLWKNLSLKYLLSFQKNGGFSCDIETQMIYSSGYIISVNSQLSE